jgi:hypothetical protein
VSDFRGYVCWKERDLSDVLSSDAGAHGHLRGVFAATHRAIPGVREAAGVSTPVADAAVDALQFLTADVEGSDPVVIPVLGDPGTGKSHLIRWVWTRLERAAPANLVVIYLPRVRTNFAGVVELLLQKAIEDDDPDVRAMAESLINYSSDLAAQDVATVAARLKTEMFAILGQRQSDSAATPALLKDLRTIVIEGGELVDYFASVDSAVGRRARRFVAEDDSDELAEDSGFTVDELEGLNDLCRQGASTPFVDAVRRLVVHRSHGELETALRLMNWALDKAVAAQMEAGGQGRPTLNVVFRRLRESLQRAGRELAILVEDLKLLHGVERALLEVLIDPADAIGVEPACRVRALVACTRGPWRDILDDNETLASRLRSWQQPTYTLSVPEEQSREETLAQLDDLAAAYLNAARVGVELLESEYDSVDEDARDSWLPSVACDTCPHRTACHEAFGRVQRTDGTEIGLYPFNRDALARAQELVQRRSGTSLDRQLNPRVLLTQVLRPALRTGAAGLPAQTFPPQELAEKLGIPRAPEVVRRLEAVGYPREDIARASAALLLWGQRTDATQVLASGIADAFDLQAPPPIGADDTPLEGPVPDEAPEPTDSTPARRDARQQALSDWLNGEPLPQRVANEVRQAVHRLVLDFVDWADFAGVSSRSDSLLHELGLRTAEHSISIAGAAVGESEPPAMTTQIPFDRDEDSYRFFLAALRVSRRAADAELSGSDLIDLAEGLERAAATVTHESRVRGVARGLPIDAGEPALQALAVASAVLGVPGASAQDPPVLLSALLAPTLAAGEVENGGGLARLQTAAVQGVRRATGDSFFGERDPVNRDAARGWLLRRIAMRQSPQAAESETVHAVDAARLVAAITEIASYGDFSDDHISPVEDAPNGRPSFARLSSNLVTQLPEVLAQETATAGSWRKKVAEHVELAAGCDESGEEWFASFRAALASLLPVLSLVRETGLVPSGNLYADLTEQISGLAPHFKEGAESTKPALHDLCRIIGWRDSPNSRELAALVSERYRDSQTLMRATAALVDTADRFLIQATNFVTDRLAEEDPILAQFDHEFARALDKAADLLEAT